MDISAICPRQEYLNEFKRCWPDMNKIADWHRKYTPWVTEIVIQGFIKEYQQKIEKYEDTQITKTILKEAIEQHKKNRMEMQQEIQQSNQIVEEVKKQGI